MGNLFAGLEGLGLKSLDNVEIFEKTVSKSATKEEKVITEADLIYDKTFICPACDKEFTAKLIKVGKNKLVSVDTDLRPRYQLMDALKYDVVVCTNCGYGALNKYFASLTYKQAGLIKSSISASFRGITTKGDTYSYDDALMRYKLALVNTIVKKSKISERAYVCLKTAWILRGKAEALPTDTPDRENVIKSLGEEETDFIEKAYEGFTSAYSKEDFPMCGMDGVTVSYLLADLARRLGKYEEASRNISAVLISKEANERIKERARELKEMIREHK